LLQEIQTAVVGVTYENRQEVVACLSIAEEVRLRREPDNPYDANAIRVERQDGRQIGYLNRYLAESLAPRFDGYGQPILAVVVKVGGCYYGTYASGVRVRFHAP
jgi:hypothetical protein